jgi:hypothetical protein
VLSSEPLQGENVWVPLGPGEMIGIDGSMLVRRGHVERHALAVL